MKSISMGLKRNIKWHLLTLKIFIIVILGVGLMGCIVKPNIESKFDQGCNVEKHHITLSVKQIAKFGARNCRHHHECKAQFVTQIVGASIILPVSAIISGSIALVGNSLFWLQEKAC